MVKSAKTAFNAVIVIPAYNEKDYIGKMLPACMEAKRQGLVKDVLVVNDGSRDGGRTRAIALESGVKVISNKTRMGKGHVFLQGITYCRRDNAEVMVMLDADLLNLKVNNIKQLVGRVSPKRIKMAIMDVYEEQAAGSVGELSGQRAFKVKAFDFLFIKGEGGKFTNPAKRFVEKAFGYGLETALNTEIQKGRNTVLFTPGKRVFARKAFGHGAITQDRQQKRSARIVFDRLIALKSAQERRRNRRLAHVQGTNKHHRMK